MTNHTDFSRTKGSQDTQPSIQEPGKFLGGEGGRHSVGLETAFLVRPQVRQLLLVLGLYFERDCLSVLR